MEFIIQIKTESFCEVRVDAEDILEAIDIVQNGDFINDTRCSNYRDKGIIQNVDSIKDKRGNNVLLIKKHMQL